MLSRLSVLNGAAQVSGFLVAGSNANIVRPDGTATFTSEDVAACTARLRLDHLRQHTAVDTELATGSSCNRLAATSYT